MQKHPQKSLLHGKKEVSMLKANQASVFKHCSADAVAICMLLLQYAVSSIICKSRVQFPFPVKRGSSVG